MPRFANDSKKKKLLSSTASLASAKTGLANPRPGHHGFFSALTIGLLAIADAAKARIDAKEDFLQAQTILPVNKRHSPLLHSAATPEAGAGDGAGDRAEDADTPPADQGGGDTTKQHGADSDSTNHEDDSSITNDTNDDFGIIPPVASSDALLRDYLFDRPQSILTPYQLVSPYLDSAKDYYHGQNQTAVDQVTNPPEYKQDGQVNISTISKSLQAIDYMIQQDIDKALFNESHPTAGDTYNIGKDDNLSPVNPPAVKDSKNEPMIDKLTEQKIELTGGSIQVQKKNDVVTNITLHGLVAWEDIVPWLHNNHDKLTIAPHGVLAITDADDFLSRLERGLTLAGDGLVLLRDALTQFVLDGVALGILRDANLNHRVFNNFFGDYYFIDLDTGDLLAPVDHSLLPPAMFSPAAAAPQLLTPDD